jgi:hypothetical protein
MDPRLSLENLLKHIAIMREQEQGYADHDLPSLSALPRAMRERLEGLVRMLYPDYHDE